MAVPATPGADGVPGAALLLPFPPPPGPPNPPPCGALPDGLGKPPCVPLPPPPPPALATGEPLISDVAPQPPV